MSTYLILFRFTQQGIESVKDSPARIESAKNAFKWFGAEVKSFYALMGRYDTMFMVEAPDDEAVAKAALAIASLGHVRTEIMRAFNEEEFGQIVASLG
jgi:uncharacterized protein with GYD domain